MASFSLWQMKGKKRIEDVMVLLNENLNIVDEVNKDEWKYDGLSLEFRNLSDIREWDINGIKTKYIIMDGYAERAKNYNSWFGDDGELKPREEITSIYENKIVIFEIDGTIKIIFMAGKTTASRMLGYLFKKSIWGEIEEFESGINEDLLYWIFQRVKDYPYDSLSENIKMHIPNLISYMGKTRDNINAIRGEGHRISAMLGTIAFLFNNENLKSVRPEIEYERNIVRLELSLAGTYKVWHKNCNGIFNDVDETEKTAKILIYTYLKILPMLVGCYKENVNKGLWSPQIKRYFLESLGTEIMDRVNNALNRIKAEIPSEDDLDEFELDIDDLEDE